MKVTIAWWDLTNSTQTIESLRYYLRDKAVETWENIKGMRLKYWISDTANNLWGAVMIWESAAYMKQVLPPNHATELIGYPPTLRFVFDIEAMIEGDYSFQFLSKLGLAFESL